MLSIVHVLPGFSRLALFSYVYAYFSSQERVWALFLQTQDFTFTPLLAKLQVGAELRISQVLCFGKLLMKSAPSSRTLFCKVTVTGQAPHLSEDGVASFCHTIFLFAEKKMFFGRQR